MAPAEPSAVENSLGWPVVVKPNKQGSTVGLTVVRESAQFAAAIDFANRYDDEVMIERFAPGRELTVGILNGALVPVGEIFTPNEVFDYKSKYQVGAARELFPTGISPQETATLQNYAVTAHRALKLGTYSRVDFRRDPEGRFWCLEVNSLPGMTATSLLPQSARAAGIDFPTLLQTICSGAVRKQPAAAYNCLDRTV